MNKLSAELNNLLNISGEKLKAINEPQSSVKPLPNKWSSKEILGHLVDSSINNTVRFITGQFKNDLIFSGYEHEKWVKAMNYQNADWNFIMDLWMRNNLQIVRIIENISDEILFEKRENHSLDEIAWKELDKNVPATMEYLINDYIGHMKHHLNQIFRLNRQEEI